MYETLVYQPRTRLASANSISLAVHACLPPFMQFFTISVYVKNERKQSQLLDGNIDQILFHNLFDRLLEISGQLIAFFCRSKHCKVYGWRADRPSTPIAKLLKQKRQYLAKSLIATFVLFRRGTHKEKKRKFYLYGWLSQFNQQSTKWIHWDNSYGQTILETADNRITLKLLKIGEKCSMIARWI